MPRYKIVAYGMSEVEGVAYVDAPDEEQAHEMGYELDTKDFSWTSLDYGPYEWTTDEVMLDVGE